MPAPPALRPVPPDAGERDVRFDLLRGACVLLMIFGHLGWRSLEVHFRLGFVSVAEGFFLISGATLGVVAARYAARGETATLVRRLPRRGLWLFAANLVGVAFYRALTGPLFPAALMAEYWQGVPALAQWLSFDQPSVLNVLPRYALFLLVVPPVLAALERGHQLAVLAGSAALWLANFALAGALRLPGLETAHAPYPAASWQLLFFGGMAIAHRLRSRPPARLPPALLPAAALAVAASVLLARGETAWSPDAALWVSRPLLGPLRLVNLVAIAVVALAAVGYWREPLVRRLGWLLLSYGRNALPAFLLHIPLVWLLLVTPGVAHDDLLRKPAAALAILLLLPLVRHPTTRRWLAP